MNANRSNLLAGMLVVIVSVILSVVISMAGFFVLFGEYQQQQNNDNSTPEISDTNLEDRLQAIETQLANPTVTEEATTLDFSCRLGNKVSVAELSNPETEEIFSNTDTTNFTLSSERQFGHRTAQSFVEHSLIEITVANPSDLSGFDRYLQLEYQNPNDSNRRVDVKYIRFPDRHHIANFTRFSEQTGVFANYAILLSNADINNETVTLALHKHEGKIDFYQTVEGEYVYRGTTFDSIAEPTRIALRSVANDEVATIEIESFTVTGCEIDTSIE